MKKWNIVLMAPSYGGQCITIYNIEFIKTQKNYMEEHKFESFIEKYKLKKIYSKGFEVISAVTIESDDLNDKIISKYSIDTCGIPSYQLNVKDSTGKSVF